MTDNTFIEQFLVGPSFCNAHRETILNQLSTSPALVQDAYMACVLSVPHPAEDAEGTNTEQRITTSFRRASSALAKLRSLQIDHARDISSCLALGGTILAFVLRFGGKDSLAICAQVLGLIKPAYDSQLDRIQIPQADLGFLTCLIMCETTECLLQTEVPTLRYRPPAAGSPGFVDRYIGLCGTLLPRLYDLCEHSNRLLYGLDAGREQLDGLERILDAWRPTVPAGFADNYTAPEIANMLCQAHVMQQAAMLVLHRLRFPFGTEQIAALVMAKNIFRLLDTAKSVSGRSIRCIDFALMVACLEIACEKQRGIQLRAASSIAVYSPRFIQRSEAFLTAVWEARNSSIRPIFWYHLGSLAKHIRSADVPGV